MAFTISGLTGLIFPDGTTQPSTATTTVGALRAWVNFNGTGTVAIRGSGNVSSVSDLGTGYYRINFSNAMPDSNYATIGMTQDGGTPSRGMVVYGSSTPTNYVEVATWAPSAGFQDQLINSVAIFR